MTNIPSLLGWAAWHGFAVEYVAAALLIAGGIYVAIFFTVSDANPLARFLSPLRIIGLVLVGAGIALACFTYGKLLGAEKAEVVWREKNYEARIAHLIRERDALIVAARATADGLKELAVEKEIVDAKVKDYQSSTSQLSSALAACRRATVDDDRRLCDIIGSGAAGCTNPR